MKTEYDFSNGVKNPYLGKYIKNGKATIEIEHDGYTEVVEYDVETGQKTVLQLVVKDRRIAVEDRRVQALG